MTRIEANLPGEGFARITTNDGVITKVERDGPERPEVAFAAPGLVDIQINGFAGVDFSAADLEVDAAISVLPTLWATGVTSFCPTLITNSIERLERNFRVLENARAASPDFALSVPVYHLEGPYLSPGPSHGAHDPHWMRAPSWDEFDRLQRAAGGNIGIVTLAPELPGALDFIRRARAAGVRVAISHTDGKPEDIHDAIRAGATLSTHLGNGCPEMIHRHLAPLWAQLASDALFASIICDNFHLPSDVVRVIYGMKGPDRCLLVTDAVHVAQLAPGRYSLVGTDIDLLESGKVVRSDGGSLSGSALSLDRAVRNFMDLAGASLRQAVQAASTVPARFLDHPSACRQVVNGQPANLVLFHEDAAGLRIEETLLHGETRYRR
jgi:N-acetylglucosamine-6-phosphate deacetylase